MNIRPYQPADDAEWLRMRRALWPESDAEMHRREMSSWLARSDAVVLVAPRPSDAGLAGFAEVGTRSLADGCETCPVAYLEGWYVDPDARRRGIGAALLHAAEAWARNRGLREFASDAELSNMESQKAHVALGFREVERAVLYLKKI
jgi:aminoglycoside 6'-N-acetyltransferase I